MFEFRKLCENYEKMSPSEKGGIVANSFKLLEKLQAVASSAKTSAAKTLAGFLLGTAVRDGNVDERKYSSMFPSLVQIFGTDFDFSAVKRTFCNCGKAVAAYCDEMSGIFKFLDETTQKDVLTLCMCAMSVDGKVPQSEKRYLKNFCD